MEYGVEETTVAVNGKMEIAVSKNKRLSLAEVVGRHDWRILEREF
jgi:hypothetical protein